MRWPGAHDEEGVTSPLTPRHERQRLVTLRSMALAASASSLPTSPSGSGASTDPTDSSLLRLRTLADLNISTPQRDSAPQQPQPQQEQQMRHHRDPMSSSNSGGGGGAECGGGGGDTPSLSEGEHQQSGGAPFSRLLEMRRRVALAKYSPFMPPLDTEHVAPPDAMTLPPPASSLSSSSPPAIRTLPSPVRSGAQHDEEESQASVGRLKRWSFGMDLQPIPTSSASTPFPQPTLTSAYPSSSTAINGAREESEDVTRPSQRRRVEEGTSNVAANNEREEEPGERTLSHPPSAGTAPYKRSSANEEDEAERAEVVPTRGGSRGGGSGTRTATRSPPRTGKANSQSSSASPKETKPAAENGDTASITVAPSAPPTGGAKRPPAKRAPKAASRKVMKAARTPPKAAGATAKTPNKAVGSQNPGRALPLRRGSGGLVVSSTLDAPTSPGRLSNASLRSEDLSTPLRSQLLDTRESVARYQTIANEPAASAFGQVGRNDLLRAIRASTAGTASSSGSTYAIPAPRSVQLAAAAASSKRAGVTSPIISPSSQGTPSWTAVAPIYLTNPDLAFNSNTWTRVPPAPPATLPVPPPRGIAASTQRVAEADHGAGGRRCVVFDTCSLIDSEPGVMNLLTERWVVCIPYTVIDELDNLNKGKIVARGKLAEDGGNSQREWRTRRARELRNWISALQAKKSDALRIQKRTEIVDAYDRRTANNDDTILGFAVYLKRRRESVMFVSEDKFLRIKATTELGETFCFADIKRMLGVRP